MELASAMKPDPDLMRMAASRANNALDAIGTFQLRMGLSFGADGSHATSYQAVRDLADALQSTAAKLNQDALDADERLTPAARM